MSRSISGPDKEWSQSLKNWGMTEIDLPDKQLAIRELYAIERSGKDLPE